MNLHELLKSRELILAEDSLYELLRRSPEVEYDVTKADKGTHALSQFHSARIDR
jgi:hypothetical protein